MQMTPTLQFQGICADAISFYRDAVGAEVLFQQPFAGNVDPQFLKPELADKIMRAALRIGGTEIYLSDGHCTGEPVFQGISLTLRMNSREEAEHIAQSLGEGGKVRLLPPSPRGRTYCTLFDKFGVHWIVEVAQR
jgi:PhnB protein